MQNKVLRVVLVLASSLALSFVVDGFRTVEAAERRAPASPTAKAIRSTETRDYSQSWILVQLRAPLATRVDDGSFALTTGSWKLDSLIIEKNVQRIDRALAVSLENPRNADSIRRAGLDRIYRFHLPPGADVEDVVKKFTRLSEVSYAEPDHHVRPGAVIPDDLLFPQQWPLQNIEAPEAWELTTGEASTVIAIVDTGSSRHRDLAGKWTAGWDFVDNDANPQDAAGGAFSGHGTGVASIAAAVTNNAEGMAGVCWNCRLMPLRVWDQHGNFGYDSTIADAVVWAVDHGASLINFSGGGTQESSTRLQAVNYAYDAGVVFVTMTHNDGTPNPRYPAQYPETIASGGTDIGDAWATYSNYGLRTDLVAPASSVLCAQLDSGYHYVTGTSAAAPHVSGGVGLMQAIHPSLGREETRHLLRSGADDEVGLPGQDTPGFDPYHGWGRLNLDKTLQGTKSATSLRVEGKVATRIYFDSPNPLADSYDFIRGDLPSLHEDPPAVDLGEVVCLENDSLDPDTVGDEDLATPAPGEAFFYLGRFNAAPGAGSYGGSSHHRDRSVASLSTASWIVDGNQAEAQFGWAGGVAGDVNNDGYGDVIVAAPEYDNGEEGEGKVWLYLGSADGLTSSPVWSAEGNQEGAHLGWFLARAGKVNDDDFDDIVVGAPFFDNGQTDEGRVYVYLGSDSGLQPSPAWTMEIDQGGAQFGAMVAGAGDVNNDGYDDVVVGAPYFDNGQTDEGRAYLYLGSASGLQTTPAWAAEPDQAHAYFGVSLGAAGDVNGDHHDDVVIGAPYFDNGQTDEGAVFVFHGHGSGLTNAAVSTLESDMADALLGGWIVGSAGDVDGDGYDDVIATAYGYTNPEIGEGAVFVYGGSTLGVQTTPMWAFESDLRDTGVALAGAPGDFNGDGYSDVIIGGDSFDTHRTDGGRAWIFLGSASGPSSIPDWEVDGDRPSVNLGWASSAGDVDGDGYDDVFVGVYNYDDDQTDEGRAYVYRGSTAGPATPLATTDCDAGQ